ncbi:MAG TPA: small basic protein [Sedimentisphaerales bacterium]|nr:small basic protein [Sedimentisphaerales bacterium]
MSIDRSLKTKGILERHRNVLTRAERIEILKSQERWQEGETVLGLPKVAHRKIATGKKSAEEKAAEEAAKAAAATAAPGAAPASAPGAASAAKAAAKPAGKAAGK